MTAAPRYTATRCHRCDQLGALDPDCATCEGEGYTVDLDLAYYPGEPRVPRGTALLPGMVGDRLRRIVREDVELQTPAMSDELHAELVLLAFFADRDARELRERAERAEFAARLNAETLRQTIAAHREELSTLCAELARAKREANATQLKAVK